MIEREDQRQGNAMLRFFGRDRPGATAIEYALIASLIALTIIGAATSMGSKTNASLQNLSSKF